MLDCPKEILVGINASKWEPETIEKTTYYPLAYVTYIKDGKVYKQKSFDGWRNANAGTKTYANTPQQGFKVLFNVGGYKSGWNVRQTYFRVRDPRGFEFEISSSNFVNILQNETIVEGVLSGKYAYVWQGQDLNLIEDNDPVYIEGVKNNAALNDENEKVTKDNIVVGQGYRLRDHENGYYIGRLPWKTYRGEESVNEDRKRLPKTEYVLEEQLMYTFVVETEGYDKNDKKKKMKSLAGYKEIKNVKFKNVNQSISDSEVEKEVAEFYLSRVGKAPEAIDWGYGLKKEHMLKDNYSRQHHPEYFQTYDEWAKTPITNDKLKYQVNFFVVDTGDLSNFKIVVSFKFKNGNIRNYLFEECTFTPEKIIVDTQITPYDAYVKNDYEYFSRKIEMSNYNYESYVHYGIKEFTEVDKLMPSYNMHYTCINYPTYGIYNGKRYALTVNIPKAYHVIIYDELR